MATKKRQKARGEPDTASLEEAILAAPEKEELWLVLSDLLRER